MALARNEHKKDLDSESLSLLLIAVAFVRLLADGRLIGQIREVRWVAERLAMGHESNETRTIRKVNGNPARKSKLADLETMLVSRDRPRFRPEIQTGRSGDNAC